MEEFTFGSLATFIGIILIWIVYFWNLIDKRKRQKSGEYQYIEKDPWWKNNYIWLVFFRRSFYRPCASTFPYLIFIVPALFMIILNSMFLSDGHPLKLRKMDTVSGYITQIHKGSGKGSYDYINLIDDNGRIDKYRICCFLNKNDAKQFKQQTSNKRVYIWYQINNSLIYPTEIFAHQIVTEDGEIKINGKTNFVYNYERSVKFYKESLPNIFWWISYSLFGWFWLWLLNRKELPIHRLNKIKYYKKNMLKDKDENL